MDKLAPSLLISLVALQVVFFGATILKPERTVDPNPINISLPPSDISVSVPPPEILGSVGRSSEYHSTTTNASTVTKELYFTTTTENLNVVRAGTLGSVILHTPTPLTGSIELYDATTTILANRSASMTTNSIHLGSIPISSPTGTITFDTVFRNGLIAVFTNTVVTTTITWR